MANLLVGDKYCTFSTVVKAIQTSPVASTVLAGWRDLARALDIKPEITQKCQEDLNLERKGRLDVIEELLVQWRSQSARNAKLGKLLILIQNECKWNEIAESLRKIIQQNAVEWNDLDDRSKDDILNTPIQLLGRATTFNEIGEILGKQRFITFLRSLSESQLKEALGSNAWNFDGMMQKDQIPYYVKRTLTLQRQLDPKIFKANGVDVFVVQGVQWSQLSRLANPAKTDLSSNQVEKVNVRFILLQCENDYEILRKKVHGSLHRISCESENFFWISTIGCMDVIRNHLIGNAEEITENEMVTQKLSIYNSRPIAIADCPGMGKTILLSEIARQLAEHYPKRYVLTISLPDLFSSMQGNREAMSNLTFVKRCLANSCSSTPLGREILFELMNCEAAKFEVFLDAFDEIPSSQLQSAEQMLESLLQSNNLRAFITSRIYMRDILEQTVGVVSWNIQPFSTTGQINFFVRYWTNTLDLHDTTRVQEFARDFVEYLQTNHIFCGTNDANGFVGIPIKCFMLAELYSADALRHVTSYSANHGISFKFSTLCGMYQAFFAFRLEKIPDTQKAAVKEAHWVAAIQLLFPSWLPKLSELLQEYLSSSVYTKQLLSVGVLHGLSPPKFVHRTFAEFLVAEFIFSHLLEKQSGSCKTKFVEFLFDSVLASLTSSHGVQLSERIIEDFTSVLRSSTVWLQIDAEFKTLAGALGLEKYFNVGRLGWERKVYLKYLLGHWILENGKCAPYQQLIYLLRNKTEWPPDVIDQLENIPSAQKIGYQHSTIVHFIDALLGCQVEKVNFDDVTLRILPCLQEFFQNNSSSSKRTSWFFENVTRCTAKGHLSVLKILIGISVHPITKFKRYSHDWASLVITSTRHHVSFFEELSQFVESLYGTDLTHLHFGRLKSTKLPYTPLHAAGEHGNYGVVEYLVSKYGTNMISASKKLVKTTVFRSVKESPAVVSQKMEIVRLLVDSSAKNIIDELDVFSDNEKLVHSTAVTAHAIHVKLFKCLIDLGADTGEKFQTVGFVRSVLPNFTPEDVDQLVDFLTHKNLLELLFRKDSEGVSGLEQCIGWDNLRPKTLRKIHKGHKFSLNKFARKSRFLKWVVKSKWQPEMIECVVEIFNNIDLCDESNCTLLTWAAWEKSLTNITYLVSVGADVNHFSAKGVSPLSATICVYENDSCDPSLIHECIQVLLEAGANVNVRNSFGKTVLDNLKFWNWNLNLQKETIDLLIKSANGKCLRSQNRRVTSGGNKGGTTLSFNVKEPNCGGVLSSPVLTPINQNEAIQKKTCAVM